jgi:hypothetical protein
MNADSGDTGMNCKKCGAENDESSKFCSKCGNPIVLGMAIVSEKSSAHKRHSLLYILAVAAIVGIGVLIKYLPSTQKDSNLSSQGTELTNEALKLVTKFNDTEFKYPSRLPRSFDSSFSEGLLLVSMSNRPEGNGEVKKGFIGKDGNWVILPKYFHASAFSEGLAATKLDMNGKSGFIDKTGNWVIQPKFDASFSFSDSVARVMWNGKYGFIDKSGNDWVIPPQFILADDFSDGLALVLGDDGYGFIDKKGSWVFKVDKENIKPEKFVDGLLKAMKVENYSVSNDMSNNTPRGKYGFIDKTGKWVIQPKFGELGDFNDGLARASLIQNGKVGFIDKTGNWVIEPKYSIASDFSEGLATAILNLGDSLGFIDKTGNWVVQPKFESTPSYKFSEGLVLLRIFNPVDKSDSVGFSDKAGNLVIQPKCYSAESFQNGLALVDIGDPAHPKMGFIDKTGNWVLREQDIK